MFPSTSKEGHFVPLTEDFQWDPIFFLSFIKELSFRSVIFTYSVGITGDHCRLQLLLAVLFLNA